MPFPKDKLPKTRANFRDTFTQASKGHEFYSKIAMINIPASSIVEGYLNGHGGRHKPLGRRAVRLVRDLNRYMPDTGPVEMHLESVLKEEGKPPPTEMVKKLRSFTRRLDGLKADTFKAYASEPDERARECLQDMHHGAAALANTLEFVVLNGHRGYVTGRDIKTMLERTAGRKYAELSHKINIAIPPSERINMPAGQLYLLLDNLAENVEKASRIVPGSDIQIAVDKTDNNELRVHVRNLAGVDSNALAAQKRVYNRETPKYRGRDLKSSVLESGGTGIVRTLLDYHDGRARVWAEPHKGKLKYYNIECRIPLKKAA